MEIFSLVFRTLLSQVEYYERNSWDWPREVGRVLVTFEAAMLVKIEKCLLVCIAEIQDILRNDTGRQSPTEKISENFVDSRTHSR